MKAIFFKLYRNGSLFLTLLHRLKNRLGRRKERDELKRFGQFKKTMCIMPGVRFFTVKIGSSRSVIKNYLDNNYRNYCGLCVILKEFIMLIKATDLK